MLQGAVLMMWLSYTNWAINVKGGLLLAIYLMNDLLASV